MSKYRVIVDKDRCIDCGISIGRCPIHAQLLARELKPNSNESTECPTLGVFSENLNYIKELVKRCPEKALIIEKIEQT
jgi:Fe-S-cluster-containing dehydrogenase component